jgi:hypothetical protein
MTYACRAVSTRIRASCGQALPDVCYVPAMKLAIQSIALLALATCVAACGDDEATSSGSGGGSSSSGTAASTAANGSTSNASSGNGSSSGGDGGSGQGGSGDGGSGQGGSGDGGSGQGGGSGGAGQGGSGAGGGEDADIRAACSSICDSLFALECVGDVDDCTSGCVEESDIEDCREELIAYLDCSAENLDNCKVEPEECADEGEALEICLPDDV